MERAVPSWQRQRHCYCVGVGVRDRHGGNGDGADFPAIASHGCDGARMTSSMAPRVRLKGNTAMRCSGKYGPLSRDFV